MLLSSLIVLNLTVMATVFGYGFSATAVSYPAMMSVSRATAVEYFNPFFHKSAHLQMGLSIAVVVISLAISILTGRWSWLIWSLILQISGPYTIKILMPVNNRIMAEGADIHSDQMTKDLGSWGRLHFPRTIIAGGVFVVFAWLAITTGVSS